jgi:hypothetical protein
VSSAQIVAMLRASGPAAGGLSLALYGVWGGQYAAMFVAPFQYLASAICVAAMLVGTAIAAWRAFFPPPPPSLTRRRQVS